MPPWPTFRPWSIQGVAQFGPRLVMEYVGVNVRFRRRASKASRR